ncbi:AMP-binding protein [Rhodococcus ruber]|uniref:AMP-binding protein n=1 Tax=Rhodococcus ruber TaxID=1830 RepID=UPI000E6B149E|nr:AMP-binding protein [Rhodococcus ruber]
MPTRSQSFTSSPATTGFDGGPTGTSTLPQLVRRNSRDGGDRTAFRAPTATGFSEWTWSDVDTAMSEIAAGLLALNLADPVPGLVIGTNEPEFFIAEYALQAVGAIAFPLFEKMTASEMSVTLEGYGAKVAFSGGTAMTRELLDAADELGLEIVFQWGSQQLVEDERVRSLADLRTHGRRHLTRAGAELDARIAATRLDDIACIILTSGTTGISKGVLGTHRYMLDIAARYAHLFKAEPFDSYLSYLPAAFSVEQYCGMTMAAALPLEVTCAESADTVDRDFVACGARFRFLGPRQWESLRASIPAGLLSDPEQLQARSDEIRATLGLHNVKAGISAGGSLSKEVFEFFQLIGVDIRSVYGFAEVGIITGTHGGDNLDSVGSPLPSPYGEAPIEVRIDDNGEILISGGVRCAGYWGTKHALSVTEDGWLRSGDAGTWDGQVLRVIDRIGNMQQLPDGTLFAPQPLEISVCRSPFISNVLLVAGHRDDSRIGALVEINEQSVRERLYPGASESVSYADLVQDPQVVALVTEEIHALDTEYGEKISVVGIMPKPLSPDHGELTRSMKLRRAEVLRRYEPLVEAMYHPPAPVVSFDLYVGRDNEGSTRPYRTRVAAID